jgi:hypothetical protein
MVISPRCLTQQLALDWDHVKEETYDIDDYESRRAPRKEGDDLVLDWLLRKRMLRCFAGVSEDALNERMAESSRIRSQRERSRKLTSLKANMGHALSKLTGGLIGAKAKISTRLIGRHAPCLRFQPKTVDVKC